MNWFDLVLLAIALISILISFFRGFIREIISLVIWVAAILLAVKFMKPVAVFLHPYIHSVAIANVSASILVFLAVFIVGMVINYLIKSAVDQVGLGPVDKLLGIVFGAIRGLLAAVMVVLFILMSPMEKSPWFANSVFVPILKPLVKDLSVSLPKKFHEWSSWLGDDDQQLQVES